MRAQMNMPPRGGSVPVQPKALHPLEQGVAALLVLLCLCDRELVALAQPDDRCDLDCLEDAVVVIALDCGECVDDLPVADAISDAPTRHVEGLGHRREFAADVLGAALPENSEPGSRRRSSWP